MFLFQIRITESHLICIYLVQCHIDIQLYNFQCSNNQPKKQIINKYLNKKQQQNDECMRCFIFRTFNLNFYIFLLINNEKNIFA
jgi:hypothetical protein